MRETVSKKRILAVFLAVVAAFSVIGLAAHFIEKKGLLDEQFGDTGDWGDDEEQVMITLAGKDYVSDDNIDTYLVIGTDGGGEDMGLGHNGQLADFLTLMIVDNTTKKFGFIQIDRNSMVDVQILDKDGEFTDYFKQQICTAHWYGTSEEQRNENTVEAASAFFGLLSIDNYYTINMADMGAINNAIGGVVVDIDEDMTNVDPAFVKGASVHLTDDQAEKFLRARMDVGDGTNKGRMSRQTQYMQKAYNMIMSQLRENPDYINDLYDALSSKIETPEESSGSEVSRMANHILEYEGVGILQIDGKTKLGDTQGDGVEHEEFYQDEESIVKALRQIMELREAPAEDEEDE